MGKQPTITLATWGKLPVYVPLYVALVRAAKSIGITYIQVTTIITSDEKRPEGADLALWGGKDTNHGLLVPCMWRQPNWLLQRVPEESYQNYNASTPRIFTLPGGTTSGDYAALMRAKDKWDGDIIDYLPGKTDSTLSKLQYNDKIFSFLPLHELKTDIPLASIKEYLGPTDCVTSFQILDEKFNHIVTPLMEELRKEFDSLFDMEGELESFYSTHLYPIADIKFPQQISKDYLDSLFQDSKQIATCVSEYLRRGCYFPYRSFGSIAHSLNEMMRENYKQAIEIGFKNSEAQLDKLYKAGPVWSHYTYEERAKAFDNWQFRTGTKKDGNLSDAFAHRTEVENFDPSNVIVNPTSPVLLSQYYTSDLPRRCAKLSGVCDDSIEEFHCFMCHVLGSGYNILSRAAFLLKDLMAQVTPCYENLGANRNEGRSAFNSLHITWYDIKDLFEIFDDETKRRDKLDGSDRNINVVILDDSDNKNVFMAISLYGDTSPQSGGNGPNSATNRTKKLQAKLAEIGYKSE